MPDFASRFASSGTDSLRRLAEPRSHTTSRAPRRELSPATPEPSTTPAERLLRFGGRGLMLRLATRCRTPLSTPEATPCSAYRPHAPLRRPHRQLDWANSHRQSESSSKLKQTPHHPMHQSVTDRHSIEFPPEQSTNNFADFVPIFHNLVPIFHNLTIEGTPYYPYPMHSLQCSISPSSTLSGASE